MLRTDDLRCTSCAHRVLDNPTFCGCFCHATGFTFDEFDRPVYAESRVGREPLAPSRTERPSPAPASPGGVRRGGWGTVTHLLVAAACIVLMSTLFGAAHGWHTSRWDAVAGAGLALLLVTVGMRLREGR